MKKILSIVGICTLIFVLYTVHYYNRSIKYQAFTGMVTLNIVDYDGNIVSNANVEICFANALNNNRCVRKGKTDANGFFIAKGVSDGDIIYKITKEGCYRTKERYWFSRGGTERSKWFPWILKFTPWNPTLDVVLKDIRNPISMYYKSIEINIPEKNTPLGFDFRKGDWVAPYGKGDISHVMFIYISEVVDPWTFNKKLIVQKGSHLSGVQECITDTYSKFVSMYSAPSDNYKGQRIYTFNRTKTDIIEHVELDKSKYIIIRYTDGNGQSYWGCILPTLRYGKMGGRILLRFAYYFNPTPNDRNLEWNGSNLFDSVESD